MRTRPLRESDIPILQEIGRASGFPYPDLTGPHIEAVQVVVNENDEPLAAVAANRLVELYLYLSPSQPPAVKVQCLQILHSAMAAKLRDLTYNECNVLLPPLIAAKFGRRLQRSFGWMRNHWENWFIRF